MGIRKHKFFYRLLVPPINLLLKLKFGYKYEKPGKLPENYIVLSTHATDWDPLFVAVGMKKQMYFVGSEHISRWKVFPLIKFLVDPITRRKGTVAASTVADVLRRTRKGHSVCIFASGIRTWDGVTFPILPSTGKLIKSAGCGLVTYRISGGYFVSPVWSEGSGTRRGHIKGEPVGIYTKEQIEAMSVEEINRVINEDLYENAYEQQLADPKPYRGKNLAERLENLLYICPECGGYDTFTSKKDKVTCGSCGLSFTYDKYGMLHGVEYKTVYDFSQWQRGKAAEDAAADVAYTSPKASIYEVGEEGETLVDRGELSMDSKAIRCGSTELAMEEINNLDIHGKHHLVFAVGKKYYEVAVESGCAFKYVLLFREHKKASN